MGCCKAYVICSNYCCLPVRYTGTVCKDAECNCPRLHNAFPSMPAARMSRIQWCPCAQRRAGHGHPPLSKAGLSVTVRLPVCQTQVHSVDEYPKIATRTDAPLRRGENDVAAACKDNFVVYHHRDSPSAVLTATVTILSGNSAWLRTVLM